MTTVVDPTEGLPKAEPVSVAADAVASDAESAGALQADAGDALRVFISSRMEELAEERGVVRAAAVATGFDPWVFESDAGARPGPPRDTYLQALETSDVFIGILWRSRGAYTVDEFDAAARTGIPRLVYEKHAVSSDREPDLQALIDEIGQVERGVTIRRFHDTDELRELVGQDLAWVASELRQVRSTNGGTYTTTRHGGRYDRIAAQTPIRRARAETSSCSRPPEPFVDRVVQRQRIREAILSGESLVGYGGEPGAGKTATLRSLAHDEWTSDQFPDAGGVCFDADSSPDLGDVLRAIWFALYRVGDHLYVPDDRELRRGLVDKRALIFIDNIQLPADQVSGLRDAMPRSVFVVAGNDRHDQLGSLSYVKAVPLEGFDDPDDMLALFEAVLHEEVAPGVKDDVIALCKATTGNPGRITRLANDAWGSDKSLAEWVDEQRQLDDDPIAAILSRRSTEDELRALALLAAFSPDLATPVEVMHRLGVADAQLAALTSRGDAQEDRGSYRLGGATYVAITDLAAPTEARGEIFDATVAWVAEAAPERIDRSRGFILRVLAWGAEQQRHRGVLVLARALDEPLALAGAWGSWGVVLDKAIDAAKALDEDSALAWGLHERGTRQLMLGERRTARRDLKQARRLRTKLGDHAARAVTRHNLTMAGSAFFLPKAAVGAVGVVAVVAALQMMPSGAPTLEFGDVATGNQATVSHTLTNDAGTVQQQEVAVDGDAAFCVITDDAETCGQPSVGALPGPGTYAAAPATGTARVAVLSVALPAAPRGEPPACDHSQPGRAGIVVVDVPPKASCTVTVRFAPTLDPDESQRDFRATLRVVAGDHEKDRPLHGRGVQLETTTTEPDDPPPTTDPPEAPSPRVALLLGIRGAGRVTSSIGGIDSCGTACSRLIDAGTVVSLTAVPDEGSTFTGWAGCDTLPESTNTCVVDMSEDRGVTVSFDGSGLPGHFLTVQVSGTGTGSVSSSPDGIVSCETACSHSFEEGTVVTLTAVPDEGSAFSGWAGCDTLPESTCVVDLSEDRAITARFEPKAPGEESFLTVQVSGTGTGSGSVSSSPSGIESCREACSSSFGTGSDVVLTAVPDPGSVFAGWNQACTGTVATCVVTVTDDATAVATFEAVPEWFTLRVTVSGSGSVSSSPGGIDSCVESCEATFVEGTVVTLTATPGSGWTFAGWDAPCDSAAATCQITMNEDQAAHASFTEPVWFTLTVTVSGSGSVSSSPGGIDSCVETCNATFVEGTVVTLTATPGSGWVLARWVAPCDWEAATCQITMNEDQAALASFTELESYALTVTVSGSGSVSSSPGGIASCVESCEATFVEGTVVTLTAATGSGWTFEGWDAPCDSGATTCQITMNSDQDAHASFTELESYALRVTVSGSGSVSSSPGGIASCVESCEATFVEGTVVTLTATPGSDWTFAGWDAPCDSAAATCQIIMNSDQDAHASFSD